MFLYKHEKFRRAHAGNLSRTCAAHSVPKTSAVPNSARMDVQVWHCDIFPCMLDCCDRFKFVRSGCPLQCHQKCTLGRVMLSCLNTNQPVGRKSGLGRLQNWAGLAKTLRAFFLFLVQCLSGSRRGGSQREPEPSKPGFGGQWGTQKPSNLMPKVATAIRSKFPEMPMIVRAKVGQTHRPKAPIISLGKRWRRPGL